MPVLSSRWIQIAQLLSIHVLLTCIQIISDATFFFWSFILLPSLFSPSFSFLFVFVSPVGGAPTGGFNILLTSNVPHGAGMSNSAANCVALGLVFNALYPLLNISKTIELVTFARCSENSKFAGGQCGWLDQLLIAESEEGKKE